MHIYLRSEQTGQRQATENNVQPELCNKYLKKKKKKTITKEKEHELEQHL